VTTADGARVVVHDLGGRGPDLLMVHATGMHGMVWEPVAHHLADRFHCWAPDLRGHGDSTPPPDPPHDWSGFRHDLLAVVEALGLRGGLAVGHSMGGANLMATEALHPGTFGALWVFEPAVAIGRRDDDPKSNDSIAVAAHRRATFASKEAARDRYGSRPPLDCFTAEALWAYVDHGFRELDDGTVELKCLPAVEAGVFDGFLRAGVDALLPRVGCPVFVANGVAPGQSMDVGMGRAMAALLPHGEVVELPGLNHFGPMQAPDVLAASILASFSRLG
jgi:pimeloyl-ACP methyl ester carboxylesterase